MLIDERNYQEILDEKQAAVKGGLHFSGKYLYTGLDKVETRYLDVTDDNFIAEYFHKPSGQRAYYQAYPFKKGELLGLLREAGFSRIEQFSDYKPGDNPEADFYQYVCMK